LIDKLNFEKMFTKLEYKISMFLNNKNLKFCKSFSKKSCLLITILLKNLEKKLPNDHSPYFELITLVFTINFVLFLNEYEWMTSGGLRRFFNSMGEFVLFFKLKEKILRLYTIICSK